MEPKPHHGHLQNRRFTKPKRAMKITDYSVIQSEIEQLQEQDFTIEEYLTETAIVIAVANIYTTGDLVTGFSQDFKYDVSPVVPGTIQAYFNHFDKCAYLYNSRW